MKGFWNLTVEERTRVARDPAVVAASKAAQAAAYAPVRDEAVARLFGGSK